MRFVIQNDDKRDYFVAVMGMLKSCSNTVHMHFNEDHFFIQGMDSSHTCLYELRLEATWFDSYEHTAQEAPVFVGTAILSKILATCKKHQSLVVAVVDSTLELQIDDTAFTVPLLGDDESDTMVIPAVDYAAEFVMPVKKLMEMTALMKVFGDTLHVECSETGVVLASAPGGESGSMRVTIPMDDLEEYSVGATVRAAYSLGLLQLTAKLTESVTVSMSPDYPLKIAYQWSDGLADASCDQGDNRMWLFIAPKIDDD